MDEDENTDVRNELDKIALEREKVKLEQDKIDLELLKVHLEKEKILLDATRKANNQPHPGQLG